MSHRSIGLSILLWAEMIISVRILLFTIPILINKIAQEGFTLLRIQDGFVAVLTVVAVFYFLTGLAAILRIRFWKILHYLGVLVAMGATAVLIKMTASFQTMFEPLYYSFFIASLGLAVIVAVAKDQKKSA